jgi:lysyl-tRNA synthetase class 1
MQWLNKFCDELENLHPEGEIVVSSGVSPSGTYHLGTLREVLTAEAVMRELKRRGRQARHLHIVDDLDVFRKIPSNIPEDFRQYLGRPLCDVPAPNGKEGSYADFFLKDLLVVVEKMKLELEIIKSHEKYRSGFFVPAIEKSLDSQHEIRKILETVSGHKLDDHWSPIQVLEDGYLKNRPYVSHDSQTKVLIYKDNDGSQQQISYADGEVKLNWRVDWPARWWLLNVTAEPFGRDHGTKGGSYDTGAVIVDKVFNTVPPMPLPYHFINRTGQTKKMSKSAGDVITVAELLDVLPPEVIWYFILRFPPERQLFFDEGESLARLVDDFGELLAKTEKADNEKQLMDFCLRGVAEPTISRVPFSHLLASYQAGLKDVDRTIEIISRTEYGAIVAHDAAIIRNELAFIDAWLLKHAPDELKFELRPSIDSREFTQPETEFLQSLSQKIQAAPVAADGEWFHKAIYEFKNESMPPKQLFSLLYRCLIGKESGPRAGWFLSILPREWLIKRLNLEA